VFSASNERERLQNIAAHFSTTFSGVETRFGLRITQSDCDIAGITITPNKGKTGIPFVDVRHSNLCGTLPAFISLVEGILTRMWEGQDRICVFPPHSILGEIAVLSQLSGLDEGTKDCCGICLSKTPDLFSLALDRGVVELFAELKDKPVPHRVSTSRALITSDSNQSTTVEVESQLASNWLRRMMISLFGSND
jgi:hypothetical protein